MKIMKKISALLLTLCLVVPCFSLVAQAADGRISFTDPETAVGEMVEVKCVARSTSGNIGDMEIKFTFDSSSLRFDSGDGVTDDGNGSLTYKGKGSSKEATVNLKFQALKEGTATVEIASSSISDGNGAKLDLDHGKSAVKIAAGDPSKITEGTSSASSASDKEVDVNGTKYTLTDEFADADIPSGYSRAKLELDGEERQMVTNSTNSVYLAYLMDANKVGDFFLYNQDDATFAPYEEIAISDTTSIIVLSDTSKVKLPKSYKKAKLTLNEKEFPVWQDSDHEGYYVMYAMNSNGETGYYQYDSGEQTYQKVEIAASDDTADKKADTSSLLGKIQNFLEKHIQLVVLVGGLGAIIILILIIVLGVKLHNRNAELDELYDEYGIDEEEEPEPAKPAKEKGSLFGKRKKNDEDDFEEFEDDFEDFEEADYEDDFEEASYEEDFAVEEDFGDAFADTRAIDTDVFDGYDNGDSQDDLTIDDLDDLLSANPNKKRGHMEPDDTFKVDFIDLD